MCQGRYKNHSTPIGQGNRTSCKAANVCTKQRWNDYWKGKPKNWREILFPVQFAHYETHKKSPGTEPNSPRLEASV
jgi:hypothetical protein